MASSKDYLQFVLEQLSELYNKQKVPMICNIVSLILLIVFVIKSIVDYTQYSTSLNSAPFYLWVLVNALFLVIPAIILFVIGFVVKKKQ